MRASAAKAIPPDPKVWRQKLVKGVGLAAPLLFSLRGVVSRVPEIGRVDSEIFLPVARNKPAGCSLSRVGRGDKNESRRQTWPNSNNQPKES
jgi:hypothetical protein